MKFVVLAVIVAMLAFFFFRSANNKKLAAENIEIGKQFLIENRIKEGVIETDSGLQYEVLNKGEGNVHPSANSTVEVHYHGLLLNDTVFDSSVNRGKSISFPLNQVIKGWTEGVQLMVVGDKFKFYIPSELAYGDRATGSIEPGSLLIFEVELLEIK
ncbi:FKBP-type peptidyl-prolyl cis-trans isomerase [Glaciecola sp. MF2-115]|uniref:FKBP-type peptidyl-prolyl cis-trans isomerase n=1 Tax=Glaciecola sp. MF2-115 TaxID=3384827 RepID=UPI00399F92F6